MDLLKGVQHRATKVMGQPKHLTQKKQAVTDQTGQPGEEKAQRALINLYKYLKGEHKENGTTLLSMVSSKTQSSS